MRRWAKRLLKDKVEALIEQTRQECAGKPQAAAVEKELGYFVRNVKRMQYGTFRAKGYFIGSGVVEAGCKTVIGGRCKQSGMFWSQSGFCKEFCVSGFSFLVFVFCSVNFLESPAAS